MPRRFQPPETPATDTPPPIAEIDREIAAVADEPPAEPLAVALADAADADVLAGTHLASLAVLSLPAGSGAQWRDRISNVEQKLVTAKDEAERLLEQGGAVELMLALGQDGAEQLALDHRAAVMASRIAVEGLTDAVALAKRQLISAEREEAVRELDRRTFTMQQLARERIELSAQWDAAVKVLAATAENLWTNTHRLGAYYDIHRLSHDTIVSRRAVESSIAMSGEGLLKLLGLNHVPPDSKETYQTIERRKWSRAFAIETKAGAAAQAEVALHDRIRAEIERDHPELIARRDAATEGEPTPEKEAELKSVLAELNRIGNEKLNSEE
jgi:hypothetical protein